MSDTVGTSASSMQGPTYKEVRQTSYTTRAGQVVQLEQDKSMRFGIFILTVVRVHQTASSLYLHVI